MKNKLELKDIVGYLPYNLKIMIKTQNVEYKHPRLFIGIRDSNVIYIEPTFNKSGQGINLYNCFPVLRPMSDLTKPIIVKGYNNDEEFIPLIKIMEKTVFNRVFHYNKFGVYYKISGNAKIYLKYIQNTIMGYIDKKGLISMINLSLESIDLLNQYHFDYRGLIDKGLAIDINTLEL